METTYKKVTYILSILCIAMTVFLSCKKLVEIPPPATSITSGNVFKQDATAIGVLTDFYVDLSIGNGSYTALFLRTGLSADELNIYGAIIPFGPDYFRNNLSSNYSDQADVIWNNSYEKIYRINAAIIGLSASNSLTAEVKRQLLGEAKFLRAFFYFHLVNLYGGVPMAVITDYKTNSELPRGSVDDVYKLIIKDLSEAQSEMSNRYLAGDVISESQDRTRPNKWVATALLARVYLYKKDYVNARKEASLLIENPLFNSDNLDLDKVFLKASEEAIWALQPVNNGNESNSLDGRIFFLPDRDPILWQVYLNQDQLFAFEAGDQRASKWINSTTFNGITYYYPVKYKIGEREAPPTEYSVVFRLAEQYLIRAEARAELGDISGSQEDLNVIRNRAGLGNTPANDKASLLDAVMQERRSELFTEGGHRWFDLKRTGRIDAVMTDAVKRKGGTWAPYKALYPIPLREILTNPSLKGQQNPGY